jgi:hypothetical protein
MNVFGRVIAVANTILIETEALKRIEAPLRASAASPSPPERGSSWRSGRKN